MDVECWDGSRWVRTDPELTQPGHDFDVRDLPRTTGAPFQTAAQVWRAHRSGDTDADLFGVEPHSPLRGPESIGTYVVFQVAHRYGDELLLWDDWFALPSDEALDELAGLLERADAGDAQAEAALRARYDADLRPGTSVTRYSPYGEPEVVEELARPS